MCCEHKLRLFPDHKVVNDMIAESSAFELKKTILLITVWIRGVIKLPNSQIKILHHYKIRPP